MDILFIDTFQVLESYNVPIGINILSTIVNTASDYTSEVISFSNFIIQNKMPIDILFEKNYETIVNYILKKNPKIISFYTIENSYFTSLIVAKNIKEINENIKIIFAGPHASLCSFETLEVFDFIDLIAVGEGEKNVISIIDYFNNKEKIENIKGVCYRKSNKVLCQTSAIEISDKVLTPPESRKLKLPVVKEGDLKTDQIVCNESSSLIDNLDDVPMLELDKDNIPTILPIETGRGCPYNCTFCSTKTFWKRKVRLKSINRSINEIKYYTTRYNIKYFVFTHDLFTLRKKYVIEFCNGLENSGIKINWVCYARADNLDEEMVCKMKNAGCKIIFLGIETGSQRMQKVINKNLDMLKVKDTIKLVHRYNIEMKINFIYGFPQEEEEDLLQTVNLIRFFTEEMLLRTVTISKCRCYPGTHIYYTERNNLIFNEENFVFDMYPAKNHLDFIKSYQNLFSSLFMINNSLIDKYFYLDIFINYIYTFFVLTIPKTTKEIIKYYNDKLLDFYLEYKTVIKRIVTLFTRPIYCEDNSNDFKNELYNSLKPFIKHKIQDDFISQLFEFEVEMIRALQNKHSKEPKILTFDYNMLIYFEEMKKKKEKCKLLLDVREGKGVKISKIL